MEGFAEAMAWGADQEADAEEEWERFVAQERCIWTPKSLFNQCCIKWLVNGSGWPYETDCFRDLLNGGDVPQAGCNNRCKKLHPTIQLKFEQKYPHSTLVILSHLLDPFVVAMGYLVAMGKAVQLAEGQYRVSESLAETRFSLILSISPHLIQATMGDLKLSQAAASATVVKKIAGDAGAGKESDTGADKECDIGTDKECEGERKESDTGAGKECDIGAYKECEGEPMASTTRVKRTAGDTAAVSENDRNQSSKRLKEN